MTHQTVPAPEVALDLAPPTNPVARVIRDALFGLEHGSEMPPGVAMSNVRFHRRLIASPLPVLIECHERFGGVFTVPLLHQRQVMVTSPEATRQVLVDQADAFSWRGGNFGELIALLGDGVLTTDGVLHDRARTLMNPAFHRNRMEENLGLILAEAAAATDAWRSGDVVDIGAWTRDLTMKIAMRALVGFDADQAAEARRAAELFEEALAYYGTGFSRLVRGPGSPWSRMMHAKAELHRLVEDQIAVTRARPAPSADLLSVLVETEFEDGTRFSDREICDQVMTLLFAGHDTTSSTLAFLFHELARNSQVQDDVRAQVHAAAGVRADGEQLRLGFGALLGSMPLLSMSIDETLRLYPAVWIGARRAERDVEIGGYRIPSGTYVNYLPWVTHRLAEYHPMPEAFRPERFSAENRAQLPQGAYVPFGGGQRICLGQRFGLTVAHAVAATALSRFRLETTVRTRLAVNTVPTLTPVGRLLLRPVLGDARGVR